MRVRRRSSKLNRAWKYLAAVVGVANCVGLFSSDRLASSNLTAFDIWHVGESLRAQQMKVSNTGC